ncbi:AbrB/MazE/SpoVT family DNA-binding domain-containing protein [Actinomadura sp. HBU206391]|uniref:AbrB/MazE/SpoVT family DNA-binding domain-containing protein n=1 Tax=Actinomadura sp. HBU206391 TaxID=2731692 RepID=UPI00164FFAAB|nr:AbrB/MazE/SpoVT family DNA-binding domain-containing protein [Actinomadura sp. HBU206391]MBC6458642.1 AbrB/MazE/SpoVT family DNA-binding domain-containing protein [Actinomadura sp. HBU206391]
MRITSKGQVTIPASIRERYGLLPGADIVFVEDEAGPRIMLAEHSGRGRRLVDRLRGRADAGMSTEEIMALTREEG